MAKTSFFKFKLRRYQQCSKKKRKAGQHSRSFPFLSGMGKKRNAKLWKMGKETEGKDFLKNEKKRKEKRMEFFKHFGLFLTFYLFYDARLRTVIFNPYESGDPHVCREQKSAAIFSVTFMEVKVSKNPSETTTPRHFSKYSENIRYLPTIWYKTYVKLF